MTPVCRCTDPTRVLNLALWAGLIVGRGGACVFRTHTPITNSNTLKKTR